MLRPTPGRLRAVLRQAGKIRTRPRPSASITPSLTPSLSPIRGHTRLHTHHAISHLSSGGAMRMASKRCFSSHTAARSVSSRGSATLAAFVEGVLRHAVKTVRTGLAKQRLHPHTLFRALRSAKLASYQVRSPLLKGAINAFRSTTERTSNQATRSAYAQLNTPSLAFSRGSLSGFGPRPAAGPLALSPLRGGMGLQTARKFSSGGARVFDNLIVNAPLALRLASDEVEEKAKLARRKPTSSPRRVTPAVIPGARRTGTTFSAAKLPRHAYAFATAAKPTQPTTAASISTVEESTSEREFELSSYFQFPELPLIPLGAGAATTIVSLRLIDPLFDALGGRHPTPSDPASGGPRLFDAAFLVDANTALEYEHRRYLRAKAVLRVLRDTGLLTDACAMDLSSDPAMWTISMVAPENDVRRVLHAELDFEFDTWCSVTTLAGAEESQSERDSLLDTPRTRSSDTFDTLSLPSLSATSQEADTDAEWEPTSSNAASMDGELVSLPASESFHSGGDGATSSGDGSLYDSRTWR